MNPQYNNSNRINYFEGQKHHAKKLDNEDGFLWNCMSVS